MSGKTPEEELQLYQTQLVALRESFASTYASAKCDRIPIEEVEITAYLGKGGFATVYKANLPSGKTVAVKIHEKESLSDASVETVVEEKKFLSAMNSVFVPAVDGAFQDSIHAYLYIEFAEYGCLWKLIEGNSRLSEDTCRPFLAQIVCALEYIHACNVIYRDLKADNILISKGGRVKITDFGVAIVAVNMITGFNGTPLNCPPEMFASKPYDDGVDWWSFGMLCHLLLRRSYAFGFKGLEEKAVIGATIGQTPPGVAECDLTDPAKDLILKLLEAEPTKRLGNGRDGCRELKAHPFFQRIDFHKIIFADEVIAELPLEVYDGVPDDGESFKNLAPYTGEDVKWKDY